MLSPELKAKAEEFKKFFESIPEDRWTDQGNYQKSDDDNCMCALGHLGFRDRGDNLPGCYNSRNELMEVFNAVKNRILPSFYMDVVSINDGENPKVRERFGSTPKQRILKVLNEALEL